MVHLASMHRQVCFVMSVCILFLLPLWLLMPYLPLPPPPAPPALCTSISSLIPQRQQQQQPSQQQQQPSLLPQVKLRDAFPHWDEIGRSQPLLSSNGQILWHNNKAKKELLTSTRGQAPLAFILIASDLLPSSVAQRQAVRQTYLTPSNDNLPQNIHQNVFIVYRFVVGIPPSPEAEQTLIQEQLAYNDLLLVNCSDGYDGMSEKMIAGISWAAIQGQQHPYNRFDFLIKTDQDVYARLDVLMKELLAMKRERPAAMERYWSGFVHHGMKPINNKSNKNAEVSYPLPSFPPYTVGALYTLSFNLAQIVSNVHSRGMTRMLANEDQMLGVLLSNYALIPSHDRRIQQWKVCYKDMIAIHFATPDMMKLMHEGILEEDNPCKYLPEDRTSLCPLCYEECRNGSDYDWATEWSCSPTLGAQLRASPIDTPSPSIQQQQQQQGDMQTNPIRVATATFHSYTNTTYNTNDNTFDASLLLNTSCAEEGREFEEDDDEDGEPRFILVWTTAPSTFTLKQHRVVESILLHHPKAHVRVFSNTLPCHFFQTLNSNPSFDIRVARYDLPSLLLSSSEEELAGRVWLSKIGEWEKKPHFYAHGSDFLRMLLLYRYGGIYMDFDVILLHPIRSHNLRNSNLVIAEYCDQGGLDYCLFLPEVGSLMTLQLHTTSTTSSSGHSSSRHSRFYIPIGMLLFQPRHPIVREVIAQFDTSYNPDLWPCGTVFLTKAVQRVCEDRDMCRDLWILPPHAAYPIEWQDKDTLLLDMEGGDDGGDKATTIWENIKANSLSIHLWNKMTSHIDPTPGTLLYSAFEEFALYPLPSPSFSLDPAEEAHYLPIAGGTFNGGFESGKSGWVHMGPSIFLEDCPAHIHSGSYSVRMVGSSSSSMVSNGMEYTIKLSQSEPRKVLVSVWSLCSIRGRNDKSTSSNGYALSVDGMTIDGKRYTRRRAIPITASDDATPQWVQVKVLLAAREPLDTITLSLSFNNHPGVAWFDDVEVKEYYNTLPTDGNATVNATVAQSLPPAVFTSFIGDGRRAGGLFGRNRVANPTMAEGLFGHTWQVSKEGDPSTVSFHGRAGGVLISSSSSSSTEDTTTTTGSRVVIHQRIKCDKDMPSIFLLSGQSLSRLTELKGHESDYSLYADLILADGTPVWGSYHPFPTSPLGQWHNASFIIDARPNVVDSIYLHLVLRGFKGQAQFRSISLQQVTVNYNPYFPCT